MLKLGEKIISDLYLGDKRISRAYLGDKLVFEGQEPIWLEYLESDGNQYIDLDYVMTVLYGTRTEFTESATTLPTANPEIRAVFGFMGGVSSILPRYLFGYYNDVNGIRRYLFSYNITPRNEYEYTLGKHNISMHVDTDGLYYSFVNGVPAMSNGNVAPLDEFELNPLSMYLFGRNVKNEFDSPYIGKIYSFRHYDHTGNLVIDCRPCLHPQTLEPCMYDVVRKRYFYNKGTGKFKYEYTFSKLKYIESTGTQYIDTGIVLNQDSSILLDFQYTGNRPSNRLFGSRLGYANNGYDGLLLATLNQTGGQYYIQWEKRQGTAVLEQDLNRHKWHIQKNFAYLDDILVQEFEYKQFSTETSALLFGGKHSSSILTCTARVYSLQIYDNGTLVCDLIPVRKADGTVCMYDFISSEFKYNQGTGEFKASKKLFMPEYKQLYAWINENKQWVSGGTANFSVIYPVKAGKRYTLSFDITDANVVGAIFRWGFTDNPNIAGQTLQNCVRTTPQATPVVTIEAITPYGTKTPYMVVQVGSTYGAATMKEHLYIDV